MLRSSRRLLTRRKWGQRTWSPTASGGGAAPGNGISAQEALQIAYRPMPPQQTVEYEEDFGHNLMIHREFISRRHRDQMSFDIGALAYSEVELRRGRSHFAGVMNRERRGVLLGASGAPADQVPFETDVDADTREVRSARYLFDERRMQFCDRFQAFFQERLAGEPDAQHLFSLMEACAVIYGCETDVAREAYFHIFLGLDLDTLEAEGEALRSRLDDAARVRSELQNAVRASEEADALIAAVPELSLFAENKDSAANEEHSMEECEPKEETEAHATVKAEVPLDLPDDFEEYAPLYRAYLSHARGESSMASYDLSSLGSTGMLMEKRRWRALMEKIVREEYHSMTSVEQMDALVLNGQLHTIKFFDLKVGDTVREILQLLQRDAGSSADRSNPEEMSPTNPERRV